MLANDIAVRGFHRPGFERKIPVEEGAEWALSNKADAGGIFLFGIWQLQFVRNATYLRLLQLTEWKQRV